MRMLKIFVMAACVAAVSACAPPSTTGEDAGSPPDDAANPPRGDSGTDPDALGGRPCTYDELFDTSSAGVVVRRPGTEACTSCVCTLHEFDERLCEFFPEVCDVPPGLNTCDMDGTNRCGFNLPPEVMPYAQGEFAEDFACYQRIASGDWYDGTGVISAGLRDSPSRDNGQMIIIFDPWLPPPLLAVFNGNSEKPAVDTMLTCGPRDRCWFGWNNTVYPRCWVRFWTDGAYNVPGCQARTQTATLDCFPAGTSIEDAEAGLGMERVAAAWGD